MARKIIKPVFSRPRKESYPREISSLTTVSLLEKRETKALCLCVANACKRSAGTGSIVGRGRRNGFEFFPTAFVKSQIAQVNRPKIFERIVSGSSLLCSEVLATSLFFQIEDLENAKSLRCEVMKKQLHIIQEKAEIMNKYRPLLTTCGMYVVKWKSKR